VQVAAATRLCDGAAVALKAIFLAHPVLSRPEHVAALQREAQLLLTLNHPGIVACAHCEQSQRPQVMLLEEELCEGGNALMELISLAQQGGVVDESLLACITRQILEVRPAAPPLSWSDALP